MQPPPALAWESSEAAGRQDVAILRRTWDTDITNLFDTQVAVMSVSQVRRRTFGVGHGHLHEAELGLIPPLGHELRVDRQTTMLASPRGDQIGHTANV